MPELSFSALLWLLLGIEPSQPNTITYQPSTPVTINQHAQHHLIVFYQADKQVDVIVALATLDVSIYHQYQTLNAVAIQVNNPKLINEIQQQIAQFDGVIAVNKNGLLSLDVTK